MNRRIVAKFVLVGSLLFSHAAFAVEPFSRYGAQHNNSAHTTQPTVQTRDARERSAAQTREDTQREATLQQREEYLDKKGYAYGRRAEAGDRFRYGAETTPDDYGRANAQNRFPASQSIDASGNRFGLSSNANNRVSGSSTSSRTSSSTTTINQSQSIDASGNLVP